MSEWRPVPPKRPRFDPSREREGYDLLRTGLPPGVSARASARVGDRTLVVRLGDAREPSLVEQAVAQLTAGVRAGLFGPGGDARGRLEGPTLRLDLPGTEPTVARALTRLLVASSVESFDLTEEGAGELVDVTELPRLSQPSVPFPVHRHRYFGKRKHDSVALRVAAADEEAALAALTPLVAAWSGCALGFEGFEIHCAVFAAQPPQAGCPGELSVELEPADVGPEAPLALLHGLVALGSALPPVLELGLGGFSEDG